MSEGRTNMLDDEWLCLLRCPLTRLPLRRMTSEEKSARAIPDSEEALVTQDGTRFYRAVNGLPVLLPPANEDVSAG